MLQAHMAAVENHLLAISQVPANSGHPLHKGTPRESFIKEFLLHHLAANVAIGTGEIIDSDSPPNQQRNQLDIVVYKHEYPRLDMGGGIHVFFVESAVATIEVKSVLTKADLKTAIQAARRIKGLKRNLIQVFSSGYRPPSVLCYVVAYDGPATINTVLSWVPEIYQELGIEDLPLPQGEERQRRPSLSVDGIYVLGKGFIQYDNFPYGFITDEQRALNPAMHWYSAQTPRGSLLQLFLNLTVAVSGISAEFLNPLPYLTSFQVQGIGCV